MPSERETLAFLIGIIEGMLILTFMILIVKIVYM